MKPQLFSRRPANLFLAQKFSLHSGAEKKKNDAGFLRKRAERAGKQTPLSVALFYFKSGASSRRKYGKADTAAGEDRIHKICIERTASKGLSIGKMYKSGYVGKKFRFRG